MPRPLDFEDDASAAVNNILYVFGGSQDGTTLTNAVWAYNQVTNTWSSKAAMPTARVSAAAAVKSNIIYVVGGTDGVNRFNTVETYNPATNTWTTKAPLLVGKSEASVRLVGTTIVAADGYTSSMDTGDNEGYNSSERLERADLRSHLPGTKLALVRLGRRSTAPAARIIAVHR